MTCQVSPEEKPHYDLGVESAVVGSSMQAFLRMQRRRLFMGILRSCLALAAVAVTTAVRAGGPSYGIEEGVTLADQQNPEIVIARKKVEAARGGLIEARAGYLPSLTLEYFYGIDATRFAVNSVAPNGQKFSNLGSSAVATLNVPVWNWGLTQSRVKQAELRRDQAKRELSLAQRRLLAELRSLYAEAETSLNQLEGLSRSAQLAEESLKLVTLRYRNGESTVLEVVDAQNTFAQANSAYQDGAVRYRVALANLQTLTGVLTTP